MSGWKDEVQRRLQSLRLRPEREGEISEELSQHLEDRFETLRAEGIGEEEARQAVLAELDEGEGLTRQLAEVERPGSEPITPGAAGKGSLAVDLLRDLRYGIRMLRRAPAFTAVAILTLALGIGANAAIFSVLDAVLLEPLPLPDSESLVYVTSKAKDGTQGYLSYPDFEDLRKETRRFEGLSGFVGQSVNLTGRDEPMRVRGGFVSDNFFQIVRTKAAHGRTFLPGVDDKPGAELVCVVQHETWQTVFGGDPALLGSKLVLNNEPYTVVGILPEGFNFPLDELEVWMPYHKWPPLRDEMKNRTEPMVGPVARIRDGVTFEQARAEAEAIMARLAAAYPEAGAGRSVIVESLQEIVVDDARPILFVLFGAVAFVLLIACGNVASLLLARGAARSRELATRAALGASKSRLVRQMLAETGLLWLAGGAAGVAVGTWVLAGLMAMAPAPLPTGNIPSIDVKALGFTLAITALSALLFGLIPALRSTRLDLNTTLKEDARGAGAGEVRTRLRAGLTVGQVALALMLLVGCGLMARSFAHLIDVDPGFRPEKMLTMEYRLPANKYSEDARKTAFHQQVVERVRQLPGVRAATGIRSLPFSGNGGTATFSVPEQPTQPGDPARQAQVNSADPYTFETFGIPLLQGRGISATDREGAPRVAVINRRMAEALWPKGDPIGRKVVVEADPAVEATIVGVVGDIRQYALDDQDTFQIWGAQAQDPHIFNTLAVRTEGDPMQMARAVTEAVWSVDKDQPVWKVRTLESLIERSLGLRKFLLRLMGAYSVLALLLAMIGVYGLMAYSVAQRGRELGVRMALGANRGSIFRLVVGQGMRMVAVGVVLGAGGALALTRLIQSLLFRTQPHDPATFALVAAVVAFVALVACAVPARRATRLDPLAALRCE